LVLQVVNKFHLIQIFIYHILEFWLFIDLLLVRDWELINEKLEPLMPVAGINFFRVLFLLMNISFVRNVKDCIEKLLPKFISSFSLGLLIYHSHLIIPIFESFHLSIHLIFEGLHHFFLSPYSCLLIQLSSLFISCFSKFPIFDDNLLALVSPELLILQFLLLFSLSLHPFHNLLFLSILFHILVSFALINDHLSPSSFSFLSDLLCNGLLILGF
jgi:hypothetical protein